jgi:hypothetical protein
LAAHEQRIDALEGLVAKLARTVTATVTAQRDERDGVTPERDERDADVTPMTPAERAKAYRQRKAAQALPDNVVPLIPRKIAVATPALAVAELR